MTLLIHIKINILETKMIYTSIWFIKKTIANKKTSKISFQKSH